MINDDVIGSSCREWLTVLCIGFCASLSARGAAASCWLHRHERVPIQPPQARVRERRRMKRIKREEGREALIVLPLVFFYCSFLFCFSADERNREGTFLALFLYFKSSLKKGRQSQLLILLILSFSTHRLVLSNSVPLSSDCFTLWGSSDPSFKSLNTDCRKATNRLHLELIPQFATQLNPVREKNSKKFSRWKKIFEDEWEFLCNFFWIFALKRKITSPVKLVEDLHRTGINVRYKKFQYTKIQKNPMISFFVK